MRILTELHMLKGVPDEMRPFQITEYQIQETPEANFVIQRLDSQSDTWDWQIQCKTPKDEKLRLDLMLKVKAGMIRQNQRSQQ